MPEYSDNSRMLKYSFLIISPFYMSKIQIAKPKKNNSLEEILPKIRIFLDVNKNEENGRI